MPDPIMEKCPVARRTTHRNRRRIREYVWDYGASYNNAAGHFYLHELLYFRLSADKEDAISIRVRRDKPTNI